MADEAQFTDIQLKDGTTLRLKGTGLGPDVVRQKVAKFRASQQQKNIKSSGEATAKMPQAWYGQSRVGKFANEATLGSLQGILGEGQKAGKFDPSQLYKAPMAMIEGLDPMAAGASSRQAFEEAKKAPQLGERISRMGASMIPYIGPGLSRGIGRMQEDVRQNKPIEERIANIAATLSPVAALASLRFNNVSEALERSLSSRRAISERASAQGATVDVETSVNKLMSSELGKTKSTAHWRTEPAQAKLMKKAWSDVHKDLRDSGHLEKDLPFDHAHSLVESLDAVIDGAKEATGKAVEQAKANAKVARKIKASLLKQMNEQAPGYARLAEQTEAAKAARDELRAHVRRNKKAYGIGAGVMAGGPAIKKVLSHF